MCSLARNATSEIVCTRCKLDAHPALPADMYLWSASMHYLRAMQYLDQRRLTH